ncbi:MAG: proton-conducting transporter membrane subunit [Gemmatimonadota bacterium]|nr:proton-conducting transporter membrane subunit [Gemmatimonadota bacterium]MDH3422152.1 proton-conducting transporter membrane subunit [Gemmatimonadota bacterium]
MLGPPELGWLVVAPVFGAVLAFLLRGRSWPLVVLFGSVTAATVGGLVPSIADLLRFGPLHYRVSGWGAPLGIELALDGLSAAFLLTTLVVVATATVYALGSLRPAANAPATPSAPISEGPQAGTFWPLWLLLWAGLNALFLSADLFNIYVALELVGLAGVALVATAGGLSALRAAIRYFFANGAASMVFLTGVALVYHAHGTLDLALLATRVAPGPTLSTALALMSAGLMLKAALFPLHPWLPTAHAVAPAPVSALLSALVVKAPVYLLLRLWLDSFRPLAGDPAFTLLGTLGALGMIWGSSQAIRSERLKTLVAYSTVAQVGLLLAAFPIVASAGTWIGIVFLAVGHALAKAAMFLASGGIAAAYGHDRIREMTGFGVRQPLCMYAFGIAGMSLVGIPGTAGFVGKWLLTTAGLSGPAAPWVAVVALSTLFTAGYVWRVLAVAVRSAPTPSGDLAVARLQSWPALLLALLTILLGVAPNLLGEIASVGIPSGPGGTMP